nr:MAG TPA: hypothetical protein [Caudoviricetes sp.]
MLFSFYAFFSGTLLEFDINTRFLSTYPPLYESLELLSLKDKSVLFSTLLQSPEN